MSWPIYIFVDPQMTTSWTASCDSIISNRRVGIFKELHINECIGVGMNTVSSYYKIPC